MFLHSIAAMTCMALLLMGIPAIAKPPTKAVDRIIIAHDANYPPFSMIGVNGKPEGYLIDVWRAFGRNNNIAIEFTLGTWQESLDMVRTDKADAHGGLLFSEERDRFLDYGPTIMDISTALYTRKSLKENEGRTAPVGVVRGGYEEQFMRTTHPDRTLVLFDNNRNMLLAASEGTLSVFVADQPTGVSLMNEFGIEKDFQNTETLYTKPLRVAVGEGRHVLLESIQYGWIEIPENELKLIQKRWFMTEAPTPAWMAAGIGISVLALITACLTRTMSRRIHGTD